MPFSSDMRPYNGGKIAPPTMAIISSAEPILVKRPRPSIAIGKIAGHITELEKPNKAKNHTAGCVGMLSSCPIRVKVFRPASPVVVTDKMTSNMLNIQATTSALR
ncbi:hypothetical protein D3C80_1300270 [compost metagenome]